MSVRVEGLPKLLAQFRALGDGAETVVPREVKRGAVNIESGAKENLTRMVYQQPESPHYRRTGRLRNDVAHEITNGGYGAVIGNNVYYAPYVHFGTHNMPERPYLFNAHEEEKPKFLARLKRELRTEIRTVTR